MSKYPSANITLAALEDKGQTMKIKDSEGRWWVIWKSEYQTNQPSEAYQNLLNYKLGETFGVTYGEKEEEYQGKTYTKRTIYSVIPPVANPTPQTPKRPLYDVPKSSQDQPKGEKFWERQAYEKCCSLWAASLLQRDGMQFQNVITAINGAGPWELFQAIKEDGRKRFFEFDKPQENLPVVDVNEDVWPTDSDAPAEINVEDIPF